MKLWRVDKWNMDGGLLVLADNIVDAAVKARQLYQAHYEKTKTFAGAHLKDVAKIEYIGDAV